MGVGSVCWATGGLARDVGTIRWARRGLVCRMTGERERGLRLCVGTTREGREEQAALPEPSLRPLLLLFLPPLLLARGKSMVGRQCVLGLTKRGWPG